MPLYANTSLRSSHPLHHHQQHLSPKVRVEYSCGSVEYTTACSTKAKPEPGPIKGFNSERVLENLNPQVRQAWKDQAHEAIFVHYLSGGYNPNMAPNVHIIAMDLTSECERTTTE